MCFFICLYTLLLLPEISRGQLSVSSKKRLKCAYVCGCGLAALPNPMNKGLCYLCKAPVERACHKHTHICIFWSFFLQIYWGVFHYRGFAKPLYLRDFTMGASLSLQSSYREDLPHTYTHFSPFSHRYGGCFTRGALQNPSI